MEASDQQYNEGSMLRWVKVGAGAPAVTHRPKLARVRHLALEGGTTVATLLSQGEDAEHIGKAVRAAGMQWVWVPLGTARPPTEPEQRTHYMRAVRTLSGCERVS